MLYRTDVIRIIVGRGVLPPFFAIFCIYGRSKPLPYGLLRIFRETNDTLDVVQDDKRSQNRSKTGVVKAKSPQTIGRK